MDKSALSKAVSYLQSTLTRHSPEILTGIGIAGMIAAAVMAVKATPKAMELLDKEIYERDPVEHYNALPLIDKIRAAGLCYLPAVVTGGVSIFCLIGGSAINARRNAALATAYALSESAFSVYRNKMIETLGERKEQAVRDAIAKDRVNQNPVIRQEVIITESGNTLCYDAISCRYFRSDMHKIRKAENDLNRRMRSDMYISVNDFYQELGLSGSKVGEDLGWNIDRGYIDLSFSSQLADDGTPCLVIDYILAPRYDYRE
jgi:hypothetical protein